jgi:hypothetical protein
MPVRNIKSYIAVGAAAAALGLGVAVPASAVPASAVPASASAAPVRALHVASGASGEGVLWALPTASGGEVLMGDLHAEAHRRGNPTVEIVRHAPHFGLRAGLCTPVPAMRHQSAAAAASNQR